MLTKNHYSSSHCSHCKLDCQQLIDAPLQALGFGKSNTTHWLRRSTILTASLESQCCITL